MQILKPLEFQKPTYVVIKQVIYWKNKSYKSYKASPHHAKNKLRVHLGLTPNSPPKVWTSSKLFGIWEVVFAMLSSSKETIIVSSQLFP